MRDRGDTGNVWQVHHEDFKSVLGSSPGIELLLQIDAYPFAHEAGVFFAETNELFITSNQFESQIGEIQVQISKVSLGSGTECTVFENIECDLIKFANGGRSFSYEASPPYTTKPLLTSYMGKPFNSVNDVVVHDDGSMWFTDPSYGHDQGYRPRPNLPNQVYRFDPRTKSIRAIADGFGRPNGICFSPDQKTVYITDTDQVRGQWVNHGRAASIYAFDVENRHGQPFLTSRRLFAYADGGIPDGIKCDTAGNVYSGCPDGINVWSPGGTLLGRIVIPGGVANFCFGHDGEILALNEYRLWRIQLNPNVKGALLATRNND